MVCPYVVLFNVLIQFYVHYADLYNARIQWYDPMLFCTTRGYNGMSICCFVEREDTMVCPYFVL